MLPKEEEKKEIGWFWKGRERVCGVAGVFVLFTGFSFLFKKKYLKKG